MAVVRRANLIGFIRVLDRPPAFVLPLFTFPREDASISDHCLVVQEINSLYRINAFERFDHEDVDIIPVGIDLEKSLGDNCVLVYEIDNDQVLIGDRSNLREQLLAHLGSEVFVHNAFSFHQAARFCGSEPAIDQAIHRMQRKLADAPETARYIHRNVLIRDEIHARVRAEIANYEDVTSSFRLVELPDRIIPEATDGLDAWVKRIIAETINDFESRHPAFASTGGYKLTQAEELVRTAAERHDEQTRASRERRITENNDDLARLYQDVEAWNAWRAQNLETRVDLSGANLSGANLSGANLSGANLGNANLGNANLGNANLSDAILSDATLSGANLSGANLSGANLSGATLSGANLAGANLAGANLSGANLSVANLSVANLSGANLAGADLSYAILFKTMFADVDLSTTKGLETCRHIGPSMLDHQTLQRSGRLPLVFLRGCGLSDRLADYLPSLTDEAIQYHSCFISYSSKDEAFAKRLHADLQNSGVRCWFAPHDLPIEAKTWDAIDAAITVLDKVLLILSENAIASDWVEDEVSKAFAEEHRRKQVVLFPVRIDQTVMKTDEPWAVMLRDQRNIGDFRKWKDHDAYQQAFDRVLRDLKTTPG